MVGDLEENWGELGTRVRAPLCDVTRSTCPAISQCDARQKFKTTEIIIHS